MDARDLIIDYRELYKEFDARKYQKAFGQYCKDVSSVLSAISQEVENSDDPGLAIEKQAEILVDAVRSETIGNDRIRFRSTRKLHLEDYRLTVALFLMPMLQKSEFSFSESLAESILKKWKKEKMGDFEIGTYEELVKGFERSMIDVFLGKN